jgi:uncharacterized protein
MRLRGQDAQHPLVFDSQALYRQPGAAQRLNRDVTVSYSWRNDVSGVASDGNIAVSFLLESAHDGILVAASAEVPFQADCVRCLQPTYWTQELRAQQFFAYPEHADEINPDADDDVASMSGDLLDFRDAFRDAVLLALPLTPTCSDDCAGLCSQCGFALAEDPEHKHVVLDPRWSELAKFADPGRPALGE